MRHSPSCYHQVLDLFEAGERETRRTQRQVLTASVAGLCLAFLGWLGLRHVSFIDAVPGLGIFLGIIAIPGVAVEIIFEVATLHGFHDGETFAWLVFPSNAALYFTVFLLLNRMWARYRQSRNSSVDDITKTPPIDTLQ
jgi:Na+/proline symporter